ncbi:MAG: hypothetical protein K0S53_2274 [Bacteroidetes bacterium]|jgi:hypothetical protein|nr:hypothetical protein [Bacteroidota bacterium]MDF2452040.1 hypothetical protein [Bacteroidota bacterium]
MRLKLFLSVLFFCTITKAQTNIELKDFINKNTGAIRTIQKNMLRENNSSYVSSFKEIVKNQEASVKLYSTDKKASAHFAFLVRTECLDYLKKHTQNTASYFEITELERTFDRSSGESNKILSPSEFKSIDDMDAINPQSLNSLNLIVQ